MEKGADDSRDGGHNRGHLGDCDSALHHRGSVLLPIAGTGGAAGAPHDSWGPGRGAGGCWRKSQALKKVQSKPPCGGSLTCAGSPQLPGLPSPGLPKHGGSERVRDLVNGTHLSRGEQG